MKIRSIEFSNHKILKNLNFDFKKDFTLLVGENGCGKTILLEEIFKILNGGITIWNDGIDRKITVEFSDLDLKVTKFEFADKCLIFDYKESYSANPDWRRIKIFNSEGADRTQQILPTIQNDQLRKVFKCAYSTVEINFAPENIESVKATSVDNEETPKSKSSSNISKEISQLLVDIKAQDDAEYAKWMKENAGKSTKVPEITGKLDRFRNAYSKMFQGKEMKDIRPESGSQKIIFRNTRDKAEFEISALSSGEKQIVYRVGYLLRNLGTLSGGIILIDEPELSLHPIWQIKFINFLRELFTNKDGKLDIQFIIATHSPYLLKSSLYPDVDVIILTREDTGNTTLQRPQTDKWSLFKEGPSIAEINYYAYGLITLDFHNQLYGFLMELTQMESIKKFDFEILAAKDKNKQTSQWSELKDGQQQPSYNVTMTTFIRHSLHHPESQQSQSYTEGDMEKSIKYMILLLKQYGNRTENV